MNKTTHHPRTISRREFIGTASVATAAIGANRLLTLPSYAAPADTASPVRLIVGVSH